MNTKKPYFLIHESKLEKNINDFKVALKEVWPNSQLGYSVKTNSLPWILKYLQKQGVFAEVVSDEEYQLAKKCGYANETIIFNGPIKGEMVLKEALFNKSYINIDSKSDLDFIKNEKPIDALIGIRVNVDPKAFERDDIGYENDGFRFGFSEKNGEFYNALAIIQKYAKGTKLGLHLHCNSITRSINVYRVIARYAAFLIEKYDLELAFIDLGGGFFGGIEGKPSPREYLIAIKEELINVLDVEKTKLILEPGSAIVGSVVDLYTHVLDVKDTDYSRIVTTDGSRIHIDPLWIKNRYMYSIKQNLNRNIVEKQIICGYTCMDHDRLMVLENQKELMVGDELIYHRVGAYSMTFGGMFISYYPEVYVKSKNEEMMKVRSYSNVDMYIKMHS